MLCCYIDQSFQIIGQHDIYLYLTYSTLSKNVSKLASKSVCMGNEVTQLVREDSTKHLYMN